MTKNVFRHKINLTKLLLTWFALVSLSYTNAQNIKQIAWVAPSSFNELKNPFTENVAPAKLGKKTYSIYCAVCHGNSGKGDGAAAASLNPKPSDHTSILVQGETDGSLYWKMTEGRGTMASFKQILTDDQRWQLVCYIRTLAKNK